METRRRDRAVEMVLRLRKQLSPHDGQYDEWRKNGSNGKMNGTTNVTDVAAVQHDKRHGTTNYG